MKKNEIIRHIAGYSIGMSVFLILIPFLLYHFSIFSSPLINIKILINPSIRVIISIILAAIGLFFIIWSNLYLFFVGKGGPAQVSAISLSPKTKHLVASGPYHFSRNPMMFGGYTLYVAIALYLNSVLTLLLLFLTLPLVIALLKRFEEKRLVKDFGNEFIEYRKKVPIFFPLPTKFFLK